MVLTAVLQNTHVVELYRRLEKSERQLTYYDSGIGTFVKESNWLGRLKQNIVHGLDMAVALYVLLSPRIFLFPHLRFASSNLKRIVLAAYQWLSENYQRGDRIYLFGAYLGFYQASIVIVVVDHVAKNNCAL